MILPIYLYGAPVLRRQSEEVTPDCPDFAQLLDNLWETMYHAEGVGLAAPQVGRNLRLFVADTDALSKDFPEGKGFKKAFVNAQLLEETGDLWVYNEGCLSVPKVHEDVRRHKRVHLRYCDENFVQHDEWFEGICARVILHELEHLEGKSFVERLSPIRRQLLKSKLMKVSKGAISTPYRTKT